MEITAEKDLDQNGTIDADEQITYTVIVNNAGGVQPGSGSGDVTNGGVSVWAPTNDTEVLAAPNGRWENIAETGSINISKGEYGYDHNSPGQSFELRFSISNSTNSYGVEIIINGGGTQTVKLSQDGTGNSATRSLQNLARDELVDDDTDSVNILDSQNASIYQSTDPDSTFGTLAANIRNAGSTSDPAVLRTGLGRARAVVRFDAAISRYTSGTGGSPLQSIAASATTSGNSGKAAFALQNNGDSTVTITGLAIDSTTSDATEVSPQGNNNPSIISNTTGDLFFGTITIGGPRITFDQNEQLGSGVTTEIEFDRFDSGVSGEDVVITVYLADGSSEQFTLNY